MQGFISRQLLQSISSANNFVLHNASVSYKTFRTLPPKMTLSKYLDLYHVLNHESLACRLADSKVGSGEDPGTSPRRHLDSSQFGVLAGCSIWSFLPLLWLRGVSVVSSSGIPWCCHERRALFQGAGGRTVGSTYDWRCWQVRSEGENIGRGAIFYPRKVSRFHGISQRGTKSFRRRLFPCTHHRASKNRDCFEATSVLRD